MNPKNRSQHLAERQNCPRTRLAESAIGSVEVCSCGMWHLHVGALTLRLAPCAVSELLGLLGHAVAEHYARCLSEGERADGLSFFRNERGKA
jgi:hypothetical protein